MATQVSTQNSLSAEAKTFYDRTLLENAYPAFIHSQFGQSRPIGRGNGKTIEFRRFTTLAVATSALTEGTTPSGNSLEVTAITATIAQYGDYITGSDILNLTSIDPILTETNMLLGQQAGQTVDEIVRNVLAAGTNVQYAGSGNTARNEVAAGDVLTVDEVRKAVRTLKNNNTPTFNGDYVALVNPSTVFDLQSDSKWQNASQYAGSAQIFSGEIGKIYGVRFVESTATKKFAGAGTSSADVYATLVLGQNAYGIVPLEGQNLQSYFKGLGSSGTADPLDQRWSSGWKAGFAAKILNDLFMVRIEHTVSA